MKYLECDQFEKLTIKSSGSTTIDFYSRIGVLAEDVRLLQKESCGKLAKNIKKDIGTIDSCDGNKYLFKARTLRHRNNRWRATFGVKRNNSYDSYISEIDNHKKALDVDYIPKIVAYAYVKGRLGIVRNTIIITEFKEGFYNVEEYIVAHPERINTVLIKSFDLIKRHVDDGLIHLDIWLGNILVNDDLSESWLIDLEYVQHDSGRTYEEKLGFCFGFFYKINLSSYIDEDDYFDLLSGWLETVLPIKDIRLIKDKARYFARTKISRKERLKLFSSAG